MDTELLQQIDEFIKTNDVVLFMKGNDKFPMCGFSGRAVQLLKQSGLNFAKRLVTVNVLENDEIRQAIKDYSDWPTIPQLYVQGEFIGGADIMQQMFDSGELQQLIADSAKQE